jgi:hypothetical protein
LDGDIDDKTPVLLVGFLSCTGVVLGLLERLVGQQDGPPLRQLLIWVRHVISPVKFNVARLLLRRYLPSLLLRVERRVGRLHLYRLTFRVSYVLRVQRCELRVLLDANVIVGVLIELGEVWVLLGVVVDSRGRWRWVVEVLGSRRCGST